MSLPISSKPRPWECSILNRCLCRPARQQSQQQSSSSQPSSHYTYQLPQSEKQPNTRGKRKRISSSSLDVSEHRQFGTNSPSPGPSVQSQAHSRYHALEFSPRKSCYTLFDHLEIWLRGISLFLVVSTALRPVRANSAMENATMLQRECLRYW